MFSGLKSPLLAVFVVMFGVGAFPVNVHADYISDLLRQTDNELRVFIQTENRKTNNWLSNAENNQLRIVNNDRNKVIKDLRKRQQNNCDSIIAQNALNGGFSTSNCNASNSYYNQKVVDTNREYDLMRDKVKVDFQGLRLGVNSRSYHSYSSTPYTRVSGYTRSNGTYVQPHYRTLPNYSIYDNWSTKPNINPFTGRRGTRNPFNY